MIFVLILSTMFINAKYNVMLLLQCGFLFLQCFFLPHPSGVLFVCMSSVCALCSRLAFLKQSFNAFDG